MDKTNLFLGTLPYSSWAMLSMWLHLCAPQKIQENPILNIELFPIHMEMELGMLDVAGKLVKDVVQLRWRNFLQDQFLVSKNFNNNGPNFGFKEF
jgi:hypothetical protein